MKHIFGNTEQDAGCGAGYRLQEVRIGIGIGITRRRGGAEIFVLNLYVRNRTQGQASWLRIRREEADWVVSVLFPWHVGCAMVILNSLDRAGAKEGRRSRMDYWTEAFESVSRTSQPTWRAYCDALNGGLVARWRADGGYERVLKTDLFEEAVGPGIYRHLKKCSRHAHAIDYSWKIISEARRRDPEVSGIAADVRRLPFCADSFDGVLSTSTLDHFPSRADLTASMREIARVLRPGGILILTLDNLGNPLIRLRKILPFRLLHKMGVVPYYVGYTCSLPDFRPILSMAGFDLQESMAIAHCPRMPAVLLTRWTDQHASLKTRQRLQRVLFSFERMAGWPTSHLTGNYFAVKAIKKISIRGQARD
jgi:SAM-dependent methyltransferase